MGKIFKSLIRRCGLEPWLRAQLELPGAVSADDHDAALDVKRQFLANMSHEIRTPLAAILGFAETTLTHDLSERERTEVLEAIVRNGHHLLQIINDILDLSKLDSGKFEVERISYDLSQLMRDVEMAVTLKAREKGIAFSIIPNFPLPARICTDPTRLKQILVNLVGNAIKFTSAGEVRVVVSFNRVRNILSCAVHDTGIGLSQEQCARLFRAFTQADTSTTRQFGGTGLGLVISSQLAERLGGSISLESELGKGSIFTVTIDAGAHSGEQLEFEWREEEIESGEFGKRAPVPALRGRVLLVEDGTDNQLLFSYLLKKAGAAVTIAENGAKGVEAALANPFDLILMDMQMPVMDGYDATRTLREKGCEVPIVALTANTFQEDITRALNAGCNEHLGKPFPQMAFFSLLSRYLRQLDSSDPESAIHCEMNDAPEDMLPIILHFIEGLPERSEELQQSLEIRDWPQLKHLAHRMKSAGLFGYTTLTEAATVLERAAIEENAEVARSTCSEIATLVRRIVKGSSEMKIAVEGKSQRGEISG